jgi:hypothetical protein
VFGSSTSNSGTRITADVFQNMTTWTAEASGPIVTVPAERAAHKLTHELAMPIIAGAEEAIPSGYRRVPWARVYSS